MSGAVITAAGFGPTLVLFKSKYRPLALLVFGSVTIGVAFTIAQVIRPAIYLPPMDFENYVANLSSAESCECLWPVWAEKNALKTSETVVVNGRWVEIGQWKSVYREFTIGPGPAGQARIATFYYPNWKASVDGNSVDTHPAEDGSIVFDVPDRSVKARVRLEESVGFYLAAVVSALTWMALLISMFAILRRLWNHA